MKRRTTIEDYLKHWSGSDDLRCQAKDIVMALTSESIAISEIIAEGPLAGAMGASQGENADGDSQKELDIISNLMLIDALKDSPIAYILSEELDHPIAGKPDALLSVAFDPLDGSSNIDTNISVGTIFSVFESSEGNYLQPGTQQVAAGYVIYGPQTALMLTVGVGTQLFILDPVLRVFVQTSTGVSIPEQTQEFAINGSNFRHWDAHVRRYIDECLEGERGPRQKNFNMRWIASLVAECHRVLARGGVFLYPADYRPGYEKGRLRLVYEAQAIAWLIEQAGGEASTGSERILDITPTNIHQRVPLIFGSKDEVSRLERSYQEPFPAALRSPIFAERGLFQN